MVEKRVVDFVECAHYTEIESEFDAIYLQIGGVNITPQTLEYITKRVPSDHIHIDVRGNKN